MVTATCEGCGARLQVPETLVPPSGKIMKCNSCGKPVTVMPPNAKAMGFSGGPPPVPARATTSGLGGKQRSPALDGEPGLAAFDGAPGGSLSGELDLDDSFLGGSLEGAEVKKRSSPLAGVSGVDSAPTPRSALADALSAPSAQTPQAGGFFDDLPAPVGAPSGGITDLPVPVGAPSGGITDLPAPVGAPSGGITDLPAPVGASRGGLTDLPAPVGASRGGLTDLPAPVGASRGGFTDLPAPVGASRGGLTDLPAPVGASRGGLTDLPAPVGASGEITGLPAPVGASSGGSTGLPAPVGASGGITGLPAPVGASSGITGLPAPVGTAGDVINLGDDDLLAPVGPTGSIDSLAPVGDSPSRRGPGPTGTQGLPSSLRPPSKKSASVATQHLGAPSGNPELPAPKGFFDDVPAPVSKTGGSAASLPASKGFFDDLGDDLGGDALGSSGFFDEVKPKATAAGMGVGERAPTTEPQTSGSSPSAPPKAGFFDDLAPPGDAGAAAGFGNASASLDLDDLSLDAGPSASPNTGIGAASATLDLDDLDLAPPAGAPAAALDLDDLDLAPPGDAGAPALDLDMPSGGAKIDAVPALDLDGPSGDGGLDLDLGAGSGSGGGFGGIDLPSTAPSDAMDLAGPTTSSGPAAPTAAASFKAEAIKADEGLLDIDEDAGADVRPKKKTTVATAAITDDKDGETKKGPGKKQVMIAAAVLLVAGLAGGGYYYWTARQAQEELASKVDANLQNARAFLRSDKPNHWDTARMEADRALGLDDGSHDALGIAAQSVYASYLDQGTKLEERRIAGRALVARINDANASGPEAAKAEALRSIFDGEPALAIAELSKIVRSSPKDGDAQLYLGWAHSAAHDWRNAVGAYKKSLASAPGRIPALYGLGRAELALGNSEAARKAFADLRKRDQDYKELPGHVDHLGALVGSYQLADVKRFADRENLFLEITNHPQKDLADPRAVSLAWSLAGDQALVAGRIDEATRRYDKATQLDVHNLGATIGAARASLIKKQPEHARTKLEEVLKLDPKNLDAILGLAEVAVVQQAYDEAQELVQPILTRDPPLENRFELSRAHLVQGDLLKVSTEDGLDLAIAEYRKAVKLVPADESITATVALAKALASHPEKDKAAEAADILEPITDRAKQDPALAVTLGLAYRSAGETEQAETWFRLALDKRPNDVEALFQLGQALYEKQQHQDAIAHIKRAFAEGNREDIGRQLAIYYETLARNQEAADIYGMLLNVKNPSINVRARAGRFYARTGDSDRARELGESILAEKPRHPAGLFLRGEALLAENKPEDAVNVFRHATISSGEPQFFDGLGRALLHMNPPAMDEAIKAFKQAMPREDYLSPRLGVVCARMMRRDFRSDRGKVLDAIDDAHRLSPKSAFLAFSIGEIYHATGDLKKAIASYKRSLKLGVPWPGVRAFVQFRLGLAAKDRDEKTVAAGALGAATAGYERLARSGDPWGDWMGCPMKLMSRWARPKRQNDDPPWVTEGYRALGYVERARSNRGGAIRAWEKYLGRDPSDRDEARDVKRLLMNLKAR